MKRVIAGMSGGVDSAVAALLLKQSGYDVIGVTLRTWQSDGTGESRCCEIADAEAAAKQIGIPYHSFNCTSVFEDKVIEPFVCAYLEGRTPNPCIECNRYVKWEMMAYYAKVLDADYIATGHYANAVKLDNGRYTVRTADHAAKDQTYMLYKLTQEQLSRTLMPLGKLTKEEVRQIAAENGIGVAAKPDSQEICFVPDDDYAGFIEKRQEDLPGEGDFVNESGEVLGKHRGIIHYTVGQRKGLGISAGHPLYVSRIDSKKNEVVLSDEEALFARTVVCSDVNFLSIPGIGKGEKISCSARIRYHHTPAPATAEMKDDRLVITFDESVRAAAPGQSAVMYDLDGCVIGGGIIVGACDQID
ncbi:MAG: tRNA 2-thiouridine(34) synthase MnmA [Lachnospiraceae bacterium]|nr:tRNA 2-thiouridine(34) synthase MnmA [Lachnospiraceae bacterium]